MDGRNYSEGVKNYDATFQINVRKIIRKFYHSANQSYAVKIKTTIFFFIHQGNKIVNVYEFILECLLECKINMLSYILPTAEAYFPIIIFKVCRNRKKAFARKSFLANSSNT